MGGAFRSKKRPGRFPEKWRAEKRLRVKIAGGRIRGNSSSLGRGCDGPARVAPSFPMLAFRLAGGGPGLSIRLLVTWAYAIRSAYRGLTYR